MIKTIDDITFLETVVVEDINHFDVVEKFWGDNAYSIMYGDNENIPNSLAYNIYNDELQKNTHLGILTEVYDDNGNLIVYMIYRNIA